MYSVCNFVCMMYLYTFVYVRAHTHILAILLVVCNQKSSPTVNRWVDESAGAGSEPDGGAVDAHLERPLLHVAEDGHATVTAAGREREAAERQDPVGTQRHGRAAAEREHHVRERHGAVPGEVVARVQDPGHVLQLPRVDRKSTRLNSSHHLTSRMPSSA